MMTQLKQMGANSVKFNDGNNVIKASIPLAAMTTTSTSTTSSDDEVDLENMPENSPNMNEVIPLAPEQANEKEGWSLYLITLVFYFLYFLSVLSLLFSFLCRCCYKLYIFIPRLCFFVLILFLHIIKCLNFSICMFV
jgi:hypothetical protein